MDRPENESEVADLVRAAHDRGEPLRIVGGDTRSGLGRPVQAARTLTTRGLTGITAYDPREMVLTARAGTPMREIEAVLREHRQRLAFEPIDHGVFLYPRAPDRPHEPTIGGVAAANASGSRRFQVGAARDALLGVRLVNGRGEVIAAGGRVMKNVTGLDLPKVMAGSMGTLGIITEVTFKVAPTPETEATLVWQGLEDEKAIALLAAAMATSTEPSGAAHRAAGTNSTYAVTYLRLEGLTASVRDRERRLRTALATFGEPDILQGQESDGEWDDITNVGAFTSDGEVSPVWRLSVAPSDGPTVAACIGAPALFDWQGGLVWLRTEADHETVRAAVDAVGGHATLVRAPEPVRAAVPVFHPPSPGVARLAARVREAFDPKGIMNPGRMG